MYDGIQFHGYAHHDAELLAQHAGCLYGMG